MISPLAEGTASPFSLDIESSLTKALCRSASMLFYIPQCTQWSPDLKNEMALTLSDWICSAVIKIHSAE